MSSALPPLIVTGDIRQIDLPRSKASGVLEVRPPLVAQNIEAYDRYRNPIGGEHGAEENR